MKITVFTSNQPRHLALIETMAEIADHVYAIQECRTVYPGQVDGFYKNSTIMQEYFSYVIDAQQQVFGGPRFLPKNVSQLALEGGDVSHLDLQNLQPALEADTIIIFGSSYIKGELCDKLIERNAINIHMGVSPFFRGNSCNFWAMYDERPDLMGATIHRLSKGLDSGSMLYQVFPDTMPVSPFVYGMLCVQSAHRAIRETLTNGELFKVTPLVQDATQQIRYSRNSDFTDAVAEEYLSRVPTAQLLFEKLLNRDAKNLTRPLFI
jgi:hypothetical protein